MLTAAMSMLLILAGIPQPGDDITVRITSQEVASFNEWVLQLDDKQTFFFDATGVVTFQFPAGSKSFEILDPEDEGRYLGVWQNFDADQEIRIEISPANLSMHQVVSANRTTQSVWEVPAEIEVVRPSEQVEREAPQTSDWLNEQAEVVLQKTNLGGGSPIMRGVSGNRVLLMIDGFRLNNATFRLGLNQYLNTLPSGQLEQVEILSGPSGVQYGSDGLGGTIHLRSAEPGKGPLNFNYSGMYSSADQTQGHTVSSQYGNEKWGFSSHFNFNDYEDLEAADPVGEQAATGYDAWDASLQFRYQLNDDLRLRFINTYSDARNVPRTDRIVSGRDLLWEYHPQIQQLNGLRLESTRSRVWADYFEIGVGYLHQREGTERISASAPNRLDIADNRVDTIQANGTFRKITQSWIFVYGFDYQSDGVDSSAQRSVDGGPAFDRAGKFPNDAAFTSVGLFASAQYDLTDHTHMRLGLRQSFTELEGTLDEPIGAVKQDNEQLTPSLTWAWENNQWWVSLGANQGFRSPNLEDSLALGPSNQGFDAPNPSIDPEILWSYEANIRWRNNATLANLSLYTGRYEDLIEKIPGEYLGETQYQGEPVFILDNVGKAQIDGISMSLHHNLNSEHKIWTDASYVYGEQTTVNEPTSRQPPLRGNLGWQFHRHQKRLTAIWSWADRQDRLSPSDMADSRIPDGGTPGYGVVHLRGHYQFTDQIGLNLGVENIFDQLYKIHGSGIYMPGRRVILGLQASWR